jgi:hypothetical protein
MPHRTLRGECDEDFHWIDHLTAQPKRLQGLLDLIFWTFAHLTATIAAGKQHVPQQLALPLSRAKS